MDQVNQVESSLVMTTSGEKVSLATGIGMDMHFIAMMVLLAYKLKIRAHMIEHRNLR